MELSQAEAIRLIATQDGLRDVGREAGQAKHPSGVGAVDAENLGHALGRAMGVSLSATLAVFRNETNARPIASFL